MVTLFNVNQAAYILKVHPLTIRRYIREGKLKAVKAGGNVRIDEKELQEFNKDFTPRETNREVGIRQKYNPPKTFSQDDPFLRLQGRGAAVKLTTV